MEVDRENDAAALRRKLRHLDDERVRVETRITQKKRAEQRPPPPRRSHPPRGAAPPRPPRKTYFRPGRGPAESNDERGDPPAAKPPSLAEGATPSEPHRPAEADAKARKRQLGAYATDADTRRSKRLFGGLMGHLAKARKSFEGDESKLRKREEKQTTLKFKREETLKRESRAAARHRTAEGKYKDQARRDEVLTEMRQTEASLLHAAWREGHALLKHCVRTSTEPSLCWVPGTSTPASDRLLALSGDRVEAELAIGAATCEDERQAFAAAYDARKRRREEAQKRNDERFAKPMVDGAAADDDAPMADAAPADAEAPVAPPEILEG